MNYHHHSKAKSRLMNPTLVQNGSKGNVAAVLTKKLLYSESARKGNVYTEIVPDCARKTLQAIIRGSVEPDRTVLFIQIVGEGIKRV